MKKYLNRKKGLFLSVELLAVIIVVALLVSLVALGMRTLYSQYKIYKITDEIRMYREAIANYKSTFGMLPGAGGSQDLTGELNHSNIVGDYNYASATFSKCNSSSQDYGTYCASLAFRKLGLVGLIPSSSIKLDTISWTKDYYTTDLESINGAGVSYSNSTTNSYLGSFADLYVGTRVPKALFNTNLAWMYGDYVGNVFPSSNIVSNCNYGATKCTGVIGTAYKNYTWYSSQYTTNASRTKIMAPVISLYNYKSMVSYAAHPSTSNGLAPNTIDYGYIFGDYRGGTVGTAEDTPPRRPAETGALSPKIAYMLDVKIDDGRPGTGWVIAEGVQSLNANDWKTTFGCTTLGGIADRNGKITGNIPSAYVVYPVTQAGIDAIFYQDGNSEDAPNKNCIMGFIFEDVASAK